ncbi:MAG TPA: M1 family aminopeptidase [Bacilli bacterium]|nr:M1 family aminopeptidase [Bacilli bacterium]
MRGGKRGGGLWLYSVTLTLVATLLVLAVSLRPPQGWIASVQEQWAQWFPEPRTLPLVPRAAPTPTEPVYEISAAYQESGLIKGQATVTIRELDLDNIPFYLYRAAGGKITVQDVKVNGKEVPVKQASGEFVLQVKKSTSPQHVTFSFETQLPQKPTRAGVWQGVSTVSYWYPVLAVARDGKWVPRPEPLGFGDPYLMDVGTYRVTWNAPVGKKWYSSGRLVAQKTVEDRQVTTWQAEKVRQFALVGGPFTERTFETRSGTTVHVAALRQAGVEKTLPLAQSAVSTYTQTFGMDLHPVLNVLELPQGTVYAHELPNMALFSQDLWGYDDPEHWIAHEIGHVWFYSSVGNYETETPWLDEGLADYASLLEQERRLGKAAYEQTIAEAWTRFRQGYTYSPYPFGTPSGVKDGKTAVPYGTYATSQAHYYYNYLRPILMYDDLRRQMGDKLFFAFLKQYYVKNRGATATRASLEQALTDVQPDAVARLKLWLDTPNDRLLAQVGNK